MASLNNSILILYIIGSFISQTQSLTCTSQSFPERSFPHCEDLPHLNASLHWNYNHKNSSLSVAFLASPSHSGGWVAWGVNPTGTGMIGAQTLMATLSVTKPVICTLNITAYALDYLSPTLSFPVWDLASEFSQGRFTIFATIKVPPKAKSLNQVWQIGPGVLHGFCVPKVHEMNSANLQAKSKLVFAKEGDYSDESPALVPTAVGVNKTTIPVSTSHPNKVTQIRSKYLGLILALFLFIWGEY